MNRRTLAIGVVLWLTVVAFGSAVTWAFITEVGRGVTYGARPRLDGAGRLPGAPSSVTPSVRPTQRPTALPRPVKPRSAPARPTTTGNPTVQVPADAVPTAPTADEDAPSVRSPRPRRSAKPPPPPDTKAPSRGEQKVTRTWVGSSGRVTASCRGTQVALESASPSNGWRVEVESRGPEKVEVKFEQQEPEESEESAESEESEGSEVEVKVRCSNGQPRFLTDD